MFFAIDDGEDIEYRSLQYILMVVRGWILGFVRQEGIQFRGRGGWGLSWSIGGSPLENLGWAF